MKGSFQYNFSKLKYLDRFLFVCFFTEAQVFNVCYETEKIRLTPHIPDKPYLFSRESALAPSLLLC